MKYFITIFCISFFTTAIAFSQIEVDSAGNVGIGTLFPTQQLDVDGYIRVNDRIYTSNNLDFLQVKLDSNFEISLMPDSVNKGSVGTQSEYWANGAFYSLYADNFFGISDAKFKTNVTTLEWALETIKQLRGVQYDIITELHPFYKNAKSDELNFANSQRGFIAQELKEVLPEMVVNNEDGDFLMVRNYVQLLPVLVEAIKEQQATIEELQSINPNNIDVSQLLKRIKNLEAKLNN